MKRIKLIIMLFLALLTVTSFAQTTSNSKKFMLGVFGGLNIPRLSGGSNNEMTSGYSSRSGAAFGLTSNLDLGSNFSLRMDLLYSSEGGKRDGLQAIDGHAFNPQVPEGTYLYANFKNESILNYLELPVLIKYSIPVKASKFYINVGPYGGYLLKAKQKTSGTSIVYADKTEIQPVSPEPVSFNATTNTKSSIHNMSFGITGGVGYSQQIGKDMLTLDVRGATA
ncbi:porin family protein [Prolixibacter sp. SD074]|uniref:porin family protein n=1 Tax=Prolixibacter sp. SD074 TaxID=2652391 RepID=UPI00127EB6BE|nr:porin family protein [Prolixibacter sp. SD074]GET27859.1 hypothetical protein SD074_00610 [Prolixibacter sp. SD074]